MLMTWWLEDLRIKIAMEWWCSGKPLIFTRKKFKYSQMEAMVRRDL